MVKLSAGEQHNTFDVIQVEDGFQADSHNFPEFSGTGESEALAIENMIRRINHYRDNNKQEFFKRCVARSKKGLLCECGIQLNSEAVSYA